MNINIKSLDGEVLSLANIPYYLDKDNKATCRKLLIAACETYKPDPGSGDILKTFSIGLKIVQAKDSLVLDEKEAELLKRIIINNVSFNSIIIGRLNELLETSKKYE